MPSPADRTGPYRRGDPRPIEHLVWLQTAFLGDIVLTTGALDLVAREWPMVRQHLITTPLGGQALKGFPALTSLMSLDKRKASLRTSLGRLRQDLGAAGIHAANAVLLQVHRSVRSSLLAWGLGLPTITYEETSLAWLAASRVPRLAVLHECGRLALPLEALGMAREKILACRPKLIRHQPEVSADWFSELAAFRGPLVAIAPGSMWGTKRWPLAGFQALIRALAACRPTWGFVLLGSSGEHELCAALEAELGGKRAVWNLAGVTSLDDLRAVYPRLALLIANDSSPIHYASAFDVPTVALFGATTPAMGFGPLASRHRSLGVSGLGCRPCSEHGPAVCPLTHFRCMRELSAASVASACYELMKDEI